MHLKETSERYIASATMMKYELLLCSVKFEKIDTGHLLCLMSYSKVKNVHRGCEHPLIGNFWMTLFASLC
uniref:Uncharacterized protein n=1 Tax=Nelumbo nucifera TaxID=4432 RepID=A0A822YWA9_NELNU|nr:TPA_asm: hypothetical protein HUJ06_007441 [Nelumbo nucifera]